MFGRRNLRHPLAFALVFALGASLLASPVAAQSQTSSEAPPAHAMERARNGQGAINALGDRLPAVAAAHGMHPSELARNFREDLTLWVDPTLRLFYVEPVHTAASEAFDEPTVEGAAPYPLEDTFLLESRPGSQRTIFLDFDGHTATGTGWNNSADFGTGATITADAYNIDGDSTTFSTAERENIQDIWRRVAEDFAPFDVNVTTADPGYAAINRTGSSDLVFGTRLVVDGGTPALSCGCGGIAYVGVFNHTSFHDDYQPAWVFQQGTGSPKSIAEAASHEVGHNLNLNHDGMGSAGYYEGHDAWAPIMGVGYYRPISQWSKGEYTSATNQQDDLSVMVDYGIPLMTDDHGGTNAAATDLGAGPGLRTATGLISTAADVDVFSFESVGGLETIAVDPAEVSPNLDVELALYDSVGDLVATDDVASAYSTVDVATGVAAGLEVDLLAGTYYLHVDGAGAGDVLGTGYSDYGSLGHYTVTAEGTVPLVDAAPTVTGVSPPGGVVGDSVTITGTDLDAVNSINFATGVAATFTVDSPTSITTTVPAGAVDGPITLGYAGGSIDTGSFDILECPCASSSDVTFGGNAPFRVLDGDVSTWWQPTAGPDPFGTDPKTMQVTLPELTEVSSVRARWYSENYRFVDYTIEVSTNGADWTSVVAVVGNPFADRTDVFAPVMARHFRIVGTSWAGVPGAPYGPALLELDWNDTTMCPCASSSDVTFGGNAPFRVLDGDVSTWWQPTAGPDPFGTDPKTMQVTLPELTEVSSVRARWYSENYRFVDYTIEVSTNGADWTSVVAVVGNPFADRTDVFAPVMARHFRIVGTSWAGVPGAPYGPALLELDWNDTTMCPCASSSDVTFGGNAPFRVLDGDVSTWWQPTAGPDPFGTDPKTMQVTLPELTEVSSVRARWYSENYRFVDYTIEVSTNGADWTSVVAVVGNPFADRTDVFAPVMARHFRIVGTSWAGVPGAPYGPALLELDWNDTTMCPCASSSDVTFGGNAPFRVLDGDVSTWWQPTAGPDPFGTDPKTMQVTLPELTEVSSVRARWYSENYRFVDYTIEVSTNGADWTSVVAVVGNPFADRTDVFAPVMARHFRIVGTSWAGVPGAPYGPALLELDWNDTTMCPCASSSDVTFGGNAPFRVLDGDVSTWWQPTAGPDPFGTDPKTMQVTLPELTEVSSVRARWYSENYRFVDYTIEVSTNGADWTSVVAVVGNPFADRTDVFAPVMARHFRIVGTSWAGVPGAPYGPALLELDFS